MKCDFEDGLSLVSNLNVTEWRHTFDPMPAHVDGTPRRCLETWPPDDPSNATVHARSRGFNALMEERSRSGDPLVESSGNSSTPSYPPRYPKGLFSAYLDHVRFEWARTAAAVYDGLGEYRVKLDTATFVTAYGRSGLHPSSNSNDDNGEWKAETEHRLTNISSAAVGNIKADIEMFWNESGSETMGVDWRERTDQIVGRYGSRLPELMHHLYQSITGSSNTSYQSFDSPNISVVNRTAFESARHLVAVLLLPHHVPILSHISSWTLREQNLAACINFLAPGVDALDSISVSERKIAQVVRLVQHEICDALIFVNDQLASANSLILPPSAPHTSTYRPSTTLVSTSSPKLPPSEQEALKAISLALHRISDLMSNKLRWTSWKSCPRKCDAHRGEICLITLWPLTGWDFSNMVPRCSDNVRFRWRR